MIWMNHLPESCDDCPCLYDGIACQAAEFDNFVEESCTIFSSITDRHPNCPLKELVLCKDCKHRCFDNRFGFMCNLDTGDPYEMGRNAYDDDWFCADGERKDE